MSNRLAEFLARRSSLVIAGALMLTALLAVPFVAMRPDETASQEPSGPVFDARDRVNDRFVPDVFAVGLIVEADGGDMLTRDALVELRDRSAALRADARLGPKLFSYFDPETEIDVVGITSIADEVDAALNAAGDGDLDTADPETVKAAAAAIVDTRGPVEAGLSAGAMRDPDSGLWSAPALQVNVAADNEALGGGRQDVALGTDDTRKEEFARDVQEVVRGDGSRYGAWGIAIDANLTSQEQGQAAGPFIGFTILAVVIIVGLVYRSYWVLALTGAALAALIIWLQGISNLIGLKSDQILSTIVPIAMISFGVDFAFHAVGRFREETGTGKRPRAGFVVGLAAVIPALVLALTSDSAAFLANTASGIESIVQFGIAAVIALAAAFVILGLVVPVAVMRIEERVGASKSTPGAKVRAIVFGSLAATLAMATVLLSVFILPALGVALLGLYVVIFLLVPLGLARHNDSRSAARTMAPRTAAQVGRGVAFFARRRAIVVPAAVVLTAGAAVLALQVPTEFDVKDFFAADTDFVVGLDKLDEHVGDQGGEPGVLYIDADLSEPGAVASIRDFVDATRQSGIEQFARDDSGAVVVEAGLLEVVDRYSTTPQAAAAVEAATGTAVEDADKDGIPDSPAQLGAVYTFARASGIPFVDGEEVDPARLEATPDDVRQAIWISADGESYATQIGLQVPGSRAQQNVAAAGDALAPALETLRDELSAIDPDADVVLTGSPFVREASLSAVSRALLISLPIAVVLCLLIAAAFMRSLRFGVVSTLPIVLVVAWLYAFMYITGFSINLVTATIGAISIGIGIDFSIHFTMRYREELARRSDRISAVEAAGRGTGMALVASALTSVVGFAILALAPMPLFASYGFLTAVMIVMALASSLLVLPSLLVLVTRTQPTPPDASGELERPVSTRDAATVG